MTVALGTRNSKFSAALNSDGDISVSGTVKGGSPYLTAVGNFNVDLAIEVGAQALLLWQIILCRYQLPSMAVTGPRVKIVRRI